MITSNEFRIEPFVSFVLSLPGPFRISSANFAKLTGSVREPRLQFLKRRTMWTPRNCLDYAASGPGG